MFAQKSCNCYLLLIAIILPGHQYLGPLNERELAGTVCPHSLSLNSGNASQAQPFLVSVHMPVKQPFHC